MDQYSDRVLIIEDEGDLLSMFAETLSEFGFNATACNNLEDARFQLENGRFSILVTDWNIHDQKVDSLLFDPSMADYLPASILIVTAFADSVTFNNQLASKFYVLEKPFNIDKLPKVLAEITQASKNRIG